MISVGVNFTEQKHVATYRPASIRFKDRRKHLYNEKTANKFQNNIIETSIEISMKISIQYNLKRSTSFEVFCLNNNKNGTLKKLALFDELTDGTSSSNSESTESKALLFEATLNVSKALVMQVK